MTSAQTTRTTFIPSIGVSVGRTDNVAFLDVEGTQLETSDVYTILNVLLPLTHPLRAGQLDFSYAFGLVRYRDFSDLDYSDHQLTLALSYAPDRRSTLTISSSYSLSQQQGDPQGAEDPDFYLSQRSRRGSAILTTSYERNLGGGARWIWGAEIGAALFRFQEISGAPMVPTDLQLQDKTSYHASTRVSHVVTRRTSVGLRVGRQRNELSDVANEDVDDLAFTLQHAWSKNFSTSVAVGGYRRSQDPPVVPDDSGVLVDVTFDFNRPIDLGPVRLSFDAGVHPSSGGALAGTSTSTTAGISVSRADTARNWNWGGAARYTRRDPSDPNQDTIDTQGLSAYLEGKLVRSLGARVSLARASQSSDNPLAEGAFSSVTAGLVWYPLGRGR